MKTENSDQEIELFAPHTIIIKQETTHKSHAFTKINQNSLAKFEVNCFTTIYKNKSKVKEQKGK
jgi:hypothetical protein